MTYPEIILLSALQGITEFLPVSSSGQLSAFRSIFNLSDLNGASFDAWLHLGTLGAVLVYYYRTWLGILKGLFKKGEDGEGKRNLLYKIILATLPAGLAGYLAKDWIEEFFRSPGAVATGLLITAGALLLADISTKSNRRRAIDRAEFSDAWIIGLAQVTALVPGISRSGITMATGMGRGLSRKQATSFSFLMSAPIIAGAGLLSAGELFAVSDIGTAKLLIALVISFITALATISLFLKFIEKRSFSLFIVYIVILAGVLVIYG